MGHNGGRVQLNFNFLQTGGEFPFIDHLKTGQQWNQVTDNAKPSPANLNTNGYPTSGPGVYTVIYIPNQTDRPGNWIVDWVGNMTALRTNFGATTVSGATSGVNGSWTFTPTDAPDSTLNSIRLDIGITSYNAGNPITQLRVYHSSDATRIANGEVFNVDFKSKLSDIKPGVLRFLNWLTGNTCMSPSWTYRTPINYANFGDAVFFPSRDAGSTAGSGTTFTCTYPNSESLTDKIVIHVRYNASASSGSTLNGIAIKGVDSSSSITPASGELWTFVYDQDLNVWIGVNGGLRTGVPPELMVRLCNEVGAHAWLHIPYLALDNAANWATPQAQYTFANLNAGLIPIFECNNEVWNFASGFPGTTYGNNKSNARWGTQSIHDWYGLVCSTNGQAVSTIYGNNRNTYEFLCGVQSSTYATATASNARLQSTKYVAEGGGKTAASAWVTGVHVTTYINSQQTLTQELAAAYQWQTANATTRASLIATYWDNNNSEVPPDLTVSYLDWLAWAQANSVNKLFSYEGGNSQDYPATTVDDTCTITGIASSGSNTLVTISAGTLHPPIGMTATFGSVNGMTQINNLYGTITNVAGNVVTVAIDSSGFSAYTSGGLMYPVLALPITAITKASSAVITTDGTQGLAPNTGYFCTITGVSGMTQINGLNAKVTRTNNTVTTIAINSSAFSTYTSGGSVMVPAISIRKDFRAAARLYYRIYDIEYTNLKKFVASGGSFPSLFSMAGADNTWSALQPNMYHNDAQKWDAFRLFSNHKRRIRVVT